VGDFPKIAFFHFALSRLKDGFGFCAICTANKNQNARELPIRGVWYSKNKELRVKGATGGVPVQNSPSQPLQGCDPSCSQTKNS
jgi:hypothetical protein